MNNPENLTEDQVLSKIKYLEDQVHKSIMNTGTTKFAKNRMARIKVLKSYIDEKIN